MVGIRGFIFDFNGVLVDDEELHCRSAQKALQERGWTLPREDYYGKYLPYDDFALFNHFLGDQNLEAEPDTIRQLMVRKSCFYFQEIERKVPVIEPTLQFIRRLPHDMVVAIASAAARVEIEFILKRLQLRKRFSCIVSAEDVQRSKPHPEAFQTAFRQLQTLHPALRREHVCVVEDSDRGVRSAHRAGLKCVAVTTSYPPARLQEAELVVDNLDDWSPSRLEKVLFCL